jgi:hypothetical protein
MVNGSSEQQVREERRIALLTPAVIADERVTHALQLFDSVLWAFEGTGRLPWTVTAPEDAQVLVAHEDDGDERIDAWRAQGRLVVFIATDPQRERTYTCELQYPFRAVQVLTLLESLDEQLERGVREIAPVSDPLAMRERLQRWSLVDALVTFRAVENTQAWLVARDERTPVLWIRGDAGAYVAEPLAVQALRDGTLPLSRLLLSRTAEPPPAVMRRSGMELCWFAGYHASDELAPQLHADVRYRIVRWPNLALIRPLSAQLRLAAGLSARPASVEQVISEGTVTPEMAVRTFNALYACGLLAKWERPAPAPPVPAPQAQAPGRTRLSWLLTAMRRHLGLPADRS